MPVILNWIFFDPSHANKESRPIRVTRTLLDGIAANCRNLFVTALLNEFAFQAEERTVEFFKVSGPSLILAHQKPTCRSLQCRFW